MHAMLASRVRPLALLVAGLVTAPLPLAAQQAEARAQGSASAEVSGRAGSSAGAPGQAQAAATVGASVSAEARADDGMPGRGDQAPGRARAAEVRSRVDAQVWTTLERLTAGEDAAPASPLYDKALEGTAKGVAAASITTVLETYAQQLVEARAALGGRLAAEEHVVAGADALRRGVSAAQLAELRAGAVGGEALGLTIATYADLQARGVGTREAARLIGTWRAAGADAARLRTVPAALDGLVRGGATVGGATVTLEQRLRAGIGLLDGRPLGGGRPPR